MERAGDSRIAVVGAAGRFPGAADLGAYWRLLVEGRVAAAEPDESRAALWSVMRDPALAGRITTLTAGYLADVAGFDAEYFGISPREAAKLDPQQRLLLEVTHDALEDAGLTRADLRSLHTGVFIGAASTDYMSLDSNDKAHVDRYHGVGNSHNLLAGRISYFLNLKGPSLAVDTACSSSLTAMHVALQALAAGEVDLAIVGGVNVIVSPDLTLAFSQARMLSPSGRCRTFAADADGYGRAEGIGVVLLRRLDDAERDQHAIRCVIRSSAINQDGRSNGITAPNGNSQVQVIRSAMERAGITGADLAYVETHGTGTPLGDAIELGALQRVLARTRPERCVVGSAKASIGHAEGAAGIGGFLKAMLMLEHRRIPPHPVPGPHNPLLSDPACALRVAAEAEELPAGRSCIGVSSFGFGGSNAHVVIDRYDGGAAAAEPDGPVLLALSSHVAAGPAEDGRRLADFLASSPAPLGRVSAELLFRRDHLEHRRAVVAASRAEAIEALRAPAPPRERLVGAGGEPPRVAFVFTGQGAQYVDMGRSLHERTRPFRAAFDECDRLIGERAGLSVAAILYGGEAGAAERLLGDTHVAQLSLFALEYALAMTWQAVGVSPAFAIGHSLGEIVAHTISGSLALTDGVALCHERARLMQAAAHDGAMLSVSLGASDVAAAIAELGAPLHIAAVNGARSAVVSGERGAVERFAEALQARPVRCRLLRTRHAFHSPFFAGAAETLASLADSIPVGPGRIPVAGNVDGDIVPAGALGGDYWARQMTMPVQFAAGVKALVDRGAQIFLEIGPDRVLSRLVAEHGRAVRAISSLDRAQDGERALLEAIGALYELGFDLDLAPLVGRPGRRIGLPARSLARKRYWTSAGAARPVEPRPVEPRRAQAAAPVDDADDDALRAVIGRQIEVMKAQLLLLHGA